MNARSPLFRAFLVAPLALAPVVLASLATPALAKDPRIASRLYDPNQIVVVRGRPGIETTIQFREDERIDNIAVGDSTNWQVTPNKRASLVFVKPLRATTRTNMTVVTDRRTYFFDLVARPGLVPAYSLRFSYPADPPPPPPPSLLPAESDLARGAAEKPHEPTAADLHFNWTTAGARQLMPSRLFDDGQSTWLAWPRDEDMPAILQHEGGRKGQDGPLNYRVQGEYVIVDGVPDEIVLRRGKLMATLTAPPRAAPPLPASTAQTPAAAPETPAAPPAPAPAPQPEGTQP